MLSKFIKKTHKQELKIMISMLSEIKMKNKSVEEDLKTNFSNYIPTELGLKENSPEYLAVWRDIKNFYETLAPGDLNEIYTLVII